MFIISNQIYPKLSIIVGVVFVLNAAAMIFTVRKNIEKRKMANSSTDAVTAVTVDNMIAFDTVKYFAKEKFEQKKLWNLLGKWYHYQMEYVKTFRYIDVLNGGLLNIGMLLMIGVALFDYINGTVGIGDFVLASAFATLFFPSLKTLVYRFRELAKHQEDLKRYLKILDEKLLVKDEPKEESMNKWKEVIKTKVGIEYRDITFGYTKDSKLFDNLDLTIKPGETVAFVSKSGVGKTTMTKLLMRFYDVQKGKILINNINIKNISKEALRNNISIVPQEAIMFNDTIGYNIAYGKEGATFEEIKNAAKAANLWDFIESLPKGLDTIVGERGIKLSGGQKQRLAIARVFIEDAPIIVFDEATSSLDSESEKLIQEAFWKATKEKTTIIIAHRLSTIQKVDRIIVFQDGKIVEQGSHEELSQKGFGIYKYLLDLQSIGEIGN